MNRFRASVCKGLRAVADQVEGLVRLIKDFVAAICSWWGATAILFMIAVWQCDIEAQLRGWHLGNLTVREIFQRASMTIDGAVERLVYEPISVVSTVVLDAPIAEWHIPDWATWLALDVLALVAVVAIVVAAPKGLRRLADVLDGDLRPSQARSER